MTKLLSDRIKDLHLRPDAPYPSEQLDTRIMIKEYRRVAGLRLVRPVLDLRRLDPDVDLDDAADRESE